jgi:hypothetical protein
MSDSQLRRSLAASGMVESDVSESTHEHGVHDVHDGGQDVDGGLGAGSGTGAEVESRGNEACDPFCMGYDFSAYEADIETGKDMLNGLALVSNLL